MHLVVARVVVAILRATTPNMAALAAAQAGPTVLETPVEVPSSLLAVVEVVED